jgi:hypothetical protein
MPGAAAPQQPKIPDFSMPHIQDVRAQVAQAFSRPTAPPKAAPVVDGRLEREYTFDFAYTDLRGHVWKGTFTNRVMSVGDKAQHGIICAKRRQALPPDAVSATTYELIYTATWLEMSLQKPIPAWAEDPFSLTDDALLLALFEEVARHERIFRGHEKPPVQSEKEPGSEPDGAGPLVGEQIQAATES